MNRELIPAILAGLLLVATGCAKQAKVAPTQLASFVQISAYASPQRFIAERHKLDVITPESQLQKSWESLVAFCDTIQCEVLSSSITARTANSVPSGTMALRVVPGDLAKLIAEVQKLGKIAQDTTERQDKTAEVVDADAKIKNLTAFRDNLRLMLGKPAASVKDLVDIQQQLTETQSVLDSETSLRKILANETEKIAVEVTFRIEGAVGETGALNEIREALFESGSVLADSTASLITTIVAIVPWLVLIVPGIWLLAKAWRKLRKKRPLSPPPSSIAA